MPIGKIMIIDDEEDVRDAIKMQLEGKKYEILEAEDGEVAINTMKSGGHMHSVALILCDIRMPKVNGVECVDYLRAEAPGIPVVVITAFPDTELATNLMKKGIKDYLVKPVSKEKLVETADKWLAAGRETSF